MWTIGYDTIYALQDIEDDALIGVKSTARLFGNRARGVIAVFYLGTILLWLAAGLTAGAGWVFAVMLILGLAALGQYQTHMRATWFGLLARQCVGFVLGGLAWSWPITSYRRRTWDAGCWVSRW